MIHMPFPKPNIVLSHCLELEACRYNGQMIHDSFVKKLLPRINVVPVCPEVGLGMGIPREPIRIVRSGKIDRLIQPSTNADYTAKMESFSQAFTTVLADIDGFILKSRSPSCGVRDSKVYTTANDTAASGRGPGVFTRALLKRYPSSAIEDETRLADVRTRDHFLIKIFSLSRFRSLRETAPSISTLALFHRQNQLLFMTYNRLATTEMGKIIEKSENGLIEHLLDEYERGLTRIFRFRPRRNAHVNTMIKVFKYYSKQLNNDDKADFLELLHHYRCKQISINEVNRLIQRWFSHYQNGYFAGQVYFRPFPNDLDSLSC